MTRRGGYNAEARRKRMVERAYDDGREARRVGKPFEHPWSGGGHSPANNFRAPMIRAWERGYRDEIVAEKRLASGGAK